MKSMFVSLASVAFFVTGVLGQTIQINTPASPVECEPTLLSWSGGTPPYYLSVLPGGQPSAAALQNLGTQTGTSYTWQTNIAAGTSVGLTLRDSTGAIGQSAPFTIQPGSSSCLTASSGSTSATSGSASGTSGTSSAPNTSVSTTAVTSPAASGTTPTSAGSPSTASSGTHASTATSAGSSPSTSPSSAASGLSAQYGAAGVVGAAIIALLA